MADIVGDRQFDLRDLGCSGFSQSVSYKEVFSFKGPDRLSIATAALHPLAIGLAVTIAISVALYALIRAIGWVIGGFVS